MDADRLRALQAPLKQHYREAPASALIPARAEARIEPGALVCAVQGWAGETLAGLHPAAGGDGSKACSADMLLEALAACAGVTLAAVATAMGVALRGGRVVAEGTWDARGTLGIDKEAPVGLSEIRLTFELDSDAEPQKLEKLVQLAERFCVIYQSLRNPPKLTVAHRVTGSSGT